MCKSASLAVKIFKPLRFLQEAYSFPNSKGQPQGIAPTNNDVGAIPCGCPLELGNEENPDLIISHQTNNTVHSNK